jgi:hypothetical protein
VPGAEGLRGSEKVVPDPVGPDSARRGPSSHQYGIPSSPEVHDAVVVEQVVTVREERFSA